MNISIEPGKYVVAVSGGVDSMVLLDLLAASPKVELVVAHFDHGVRPDAAEDRKLVQKAAEQYGIPFYTEQGKLGPDVSEATAREARYAFLRRVQKEQGARAIVTAHHQDDMLETAILNMLRGTGRKGLSSLASNETLVRPLLAWTKKDIRRYAADYHLSWREDSTNADERYLRNYIRCTMLPRFGEAGRANLLKRIQKAYQMNAEIDELLASDLQSQPAVNELSRTWYAQLPYAVACEMMAAWLRRNGVTGFDRVLIERLVVAAKTAQPGKRADVDTKYVLQFSKNKVELLPRDRS